MTSDTASPTLPTANSNATARRSLSIFSRRGHDASSPTAQTLATASMNLPFAPLPSASLSVRGKRWKLRRNSEAKILEGTILRAVPKESPQQHVALSALEWEMATSPNEEILRNIGLSPAEPDPPVEFVPSTPITETSGSQRRRSRKGSKSSQDSIIGVWKDGSVEWDANQLQIEIPPRPKSTDGISASQGADAKRKSLRPKIQVVIPKSFSTRQPYIHRPFRSNSAIESGSRKISIPQEVSPPSVMSHQSVDSFQISALTPPGVTHMPAPLRQAPTPPVISENTQSLAATIATLKVPDKAPHHASAASSSTGSVSGDEDNHSEYVSNRSSMTSIDSQPGEELQGSPREQRRRQKSRSQSKESLNTLRSPVLEDEAAKPSDCFGSPVQPAELEGSPVFTKREGPSLADLIGIVRTPSTQRMPANRSLSRHNGRKLRTLVESNEEDRNEYSSPSPTLSEAERSLEAELTVMSQMGSPVGSPRLERKFSVRRKPLMIATPPPPPPRSAKRRSIGKAPVGFAADEVTKNALRIRGSPPKTMPDSPKIGLVRSVSTRSYLSLIAEEEDREIPADAAESVLYHILRHMGSLDDLFNMSIINRGFYRVFKRHELEITQTVLKKMSPAAWEYLETCLPLDRGDEDSAVPPPEYTAASYFESYMRDSRTIGRIKNIVLERCQSMLRVETVEALTSHNALKSSTVDNALWRIWTFCRVFGCNRNREDDLVVQTDWLKGGLLAHQTACVSTICSSDSFYISSTLLNTPEHFAMGNGGGLTAEELYDMTEMWNCLRAITQSVGGRTEQARQHGVYDNTDIRGGDIDGEELMLEEWHGYLLTLGLAPIVEFASAATPLYAFSLARRSGWTHWTPPTTSASRNTFLRDVVARLYEERISAAFSPTLHEQAQAQDARELRRQRGLSLALELRQRKASGNLNVPLFEESRLSRAFYGSGDDGGGSWSSSLQQSPVEELVHPALRPAFSQHLVESPLHAAPAAAVLCPSDERSVSSMSSLSSQFPTLPLLGVGVGNAAGASWQFGLFNGPDAAMHTAEKAIFRIVEMGFTVDQAKGALKITDMGDGLKVDRAVEFLLQQQGGWD